MYTRTPAEYLSDVAGAVWEGDPTTRMDGLSGAVEMWKGGFNVLTAEAREIASDPVGYLTDTVTGIGTLVYDAVEGPAYAASGGWMGDPNSVARNRERMEAPSAFLKALSEAFSTDDPERAGFLGFGLAAGVRRGRLDVPDGSVPQVLINQQAGTAREVLVTRELQDLYPEASIQRERLLRTADGAKGIDPLTGEGRRIDQVVIQDGRALDSVETTSQTATKAAQIAKENRIRQQGGTFVRDRETGQLIDLRDVPTRIIRKD